MIAVNPKQPVPKPCVTQGWFVPKMLQQERNVRSSSTCQHGDWLCRVRRAQAVPGQAGWLPARWHVNCSGSKVAHCWIAPGGTRAMSPDWPQLGTLYPPCPISCWCSRSRRGMTCPTARPGQESAGNKLGQKRKGCFVCARGVEKSICSHLPL